MRTFADVRGKSQISGEHQFQSLGAGCDLIQAKTLTIQPKLDKTNGSAFRKLGFQNFRVLVLDFVGGMVRFLCFRLCMHGQGSKVDGCGPRLPGEAFQVESLGLRLQRLGFKAGGLKIPGLIGVWVVKFLE